MTSYNYHLKPRRIYNKTVGKARQILGKTSEVNLTTFTETPIEVEN